MAINTIELRQERAQIIKEARAILDTAETEKRDLTGEENTKYEAMQTDIDKRMAVIEREEKMQAQERSLGEKGAEEKRGLLTKTGTEIGGEQRKSTETEEYRAAFKGYLVNGMSSLSSEQRQLILAEHRALSVGTTTAGGFTVPQGFYNTLTDAMKWYGGMRQSRATVLRTATGNPLPMPMDNDTSNAGAILAENTQSGTQDIAFTQKTLNAYKYTSNTILVSIELLQDSAFDLEPWLAKKMGQRLGRIQNTHFTVGTGTAQPQGVVTGATLGKTGLTGQTTSVIYDDLIDLEHSVDPAYRQEAQWMFNDQTLKILKKLKDAMGRPLWMPGLVTKEPDTINSYPFVINQDVPNMAANAKSMLFGDFSSYFIRDVLDMIVIRMGEKYADSGQVGFVAFARADGGLLDAGMHPIAYYANSAT